MKIAFLTSAHSATDDRIYHHQSKWLSAKGYEICIISSTSELQKAEGAITFKSFDGINLRKSDKVKQFVKALVEFRPDIAICSEPLPIYAANTYKKSHNKVKIVSDITEWNPSKKQLSYFPYHTRWLHFIKLLAYNLHTAKLTDGFIFGEWYKSMPFRKLFPKRPFVYQGYYPDLNMFHPQPPPLEPNTISLCYSGKLTKEKGFDRFISVAKALGKKQKQLEISIKIVGWYPTAKEESYFKRRLKDLPKNITVESFSNQPLDKYIELISDTDLFFDLRDDDWENQRCLPIKLFYYTALGRPVIFSDLKAIRKEVNIDEFGFLVNPNDVSKCVELIERYKADDELYQQHCRNARRLAKEEYNWEKTVAGFEAFLKRL